MVRRVASKRLMREATEIMLASAVKTDWFWHRRRLYRRMKDDYRKRRGGFVGR